MRKFGKIIGLVFVFFFVVGCEEASLSEDPLRKEEEVEENDELESQEEINEYTITFDTDYGEAISPIVGQEGESITWPSDPTHVFFDFKGWKIEGESDYVDSFDVMIDESIDLVAIWEKNATYQASFHSEHVDTLEPILFEVGQRIDLPVLEDRDGFVFIGWYLDPAFEEVFEENMEMRASHLDLYAKWVTIEDYLYLVTFDSQGGTYVDSQLRSKGTPIVVPETPIRKGYDFIGWYMDENHQVPVDFAETRSEDTRLYAKWEENPDFSRVHLVISESETQTILLDVKESYTLPQMFRDGYIFDWWYTHVYADRYNRYNSDTLYFGQPLEEDLTLHAMWIEAPNVVYIDFELGGGTEVYGRVGPVSSTNTTGLLRTVQANPGENVYLVNPSKTGSVFNGWYFDASYNDPVPIISSTSSGRTILVPQTDTTLYAKWVSDGSSGEIDDPEVDETTLNERLLDFGFQCEEVSCHYQETSGYDYYFDLETHRFSYVIQTFEENSEGYRLYDRSLIIASNYDIVYTYYVDEDYGYPYQIELELTGNYREDSYQVTHFSSNVTQEETNYEKAMQFIDNLIRVYEWLMGE